VVTHAAEQAADNNDPLMGKATSLRSADSGGGLHNWFYRILRRSDVVAGSFVHPPGERVQEYRGSEHCD
jgi:hypothetical protein